MVQNQASNTATLFVVLAVLLMAQTGLTAACHQTIHGLCHQFETHKGTQNLEGHQRNDVDVVGRAVDLHQIMATMQRHLNPPMNSICGQ